MSGRNVDDTQGFTLDTLDDALGDLSIALRALTDAEHNVNRLLEAPGDDREITTLTARTKQAQSGTNRTHVPPKQYPQTKRTTQGEHRWHHEA